jgi:hypothetical protein
MTNYGAASEDRTGLAWWNPVTKRVRSADPSPPPKTIVLVIKPFGKAGRFLGYIGIVTSRQPFLDGARALLARGYDQHVAH